MAVRYIRGWSHLCSTGQTDQGSFSPSPAPLHPTHRCLFTAPHRCLGLRGQYSQRCQTFVTAAAFAALPELVAAQRRCSGDPRERGAPEMLCQLPPPAQNPAQPLETAPAPAAGLGDSRAGPTHLLAGTFQHLQPRKHRESHSVTVCLQFSSGTRQERARMSSWDRAGDTKNKYN